MKGKLKKIENKWFVEYSKWNYSGGNPKVLGSYSKKKQVKTFPLHPNFITMTDYVWIRGIKVYDGDEVEFIEVLVNPMGREMDPNDLGQNQSKCVWYAKPYLDEKEEQKQHLVDMMISDEELKLYDEELEPYENYLKRLKERRTEDNYKYSDEDFEKYDEYIKDCWKGNMSVYKCLEFMYFAEKEIKVEDVFNDDKKEEVVKVIQQHKVLSDLTLVNPSHLKMTSDGYGEFPDGYKLTEKGIQYIIEQLNKE